MVFKRKIKSLILAFFVLALCGMISACVVDAGTGDNDDVKTDFSMSLSPKVEEIASDGSVELSVAVNVTSAKNNSPEIKWEITAGSDYAELSATTDEKVKLTGKNTTAENKSVTVKVTVTVDGTSKSDTATITVKAKAAEPELTGVKVSGTTAIEATKSSDLTATPTFTVSPADSSSVTYKWEITEGADYASLSATSSANVTLTGKNTTETEQTVTVKVTATYGGKSVFETYSVKIAANETVIPDEITALKLTAEASSVSAKGTVNLTAQASYTGSPEITFSWEITSGTDYASLENTTGRAAQTVTKSNTLTGKNTSAADGSVTVKVTASDGTVTKIAEATVTVRGNYVKSVVIGGDNSISAEGTASLRATPTLEGEPSITYKWEITEGGTYASLSADSGESVTLTGKNTEETEQTVTVKVTASDGTNEKVATCTVTVGAKIVVPTVTKISVYSGINGTSKKGEYDSVAAALAACGSSGDFRIVLPAGTYAENGLVYNGSGTIRITGSGSAKHGTDVVIKGHGSTMPVDDGSSAQNARELLLFKGTGNLILENLTLESDWLRSEHSGVSAMQAEVLGFNASGYVAAYNCSFISHQDTVRTVGKGWFYDCHIEGDVDFIWMEAGGKVALYENCEIVSVYDSAASNHATYIAAPKINLGNTAGKGVVIFNSSITAPANQKTYLFRNPWSSNPTNQYNQAAFVNCTIDGTLEGALSSSDANGTEDQQYIGWKVDSTIASAYTSKASKIGTLSADTEEKEYSGRRAILNRNYIVDSARFEKDTASNWDIDSFIAKVGWSVDADPSKDYYDGETITKVYSWDMVTNNKPSAGYLASTQDSSVKLYISQAGGSGGCPCYHPGTGSKVYIPASVGDKVEVVTHSGNYYGFTLAGKAATSNAETLTVTETVSSGQSGDSNTYVLLDVTGNCYIHSITVTGAGSSAGGESGGSGGSESGGESGGSGSGGESGGSETRETILWRADEYTAETISETKVLGSMTVLASSSKSVTISNSSKTIGDYTFASVLKFGGTGSKNERALKFTLTESSEVDVYCVSSSSSGTGRMLVLATDSAEINNTNEAPTTAGILNYGSLEAGTYYLYSNNSGINIYAVKITTAGTGSGGSSSGGTGGESGGESGGSGSGESGGETGSNVISKNDTPTGFANIDVSKMTKIVTVSSKADFKKYVEAGGYIVYVSGTIDLSEGMLPTEAGGSTSALDAFVKAQSGGAYTSYKAFIDAYTNSCTNSSNHKDNPKKSSWAACTVSGDTATTLMNQMWYLNTNYGNAITIKPKSNTMVIGLDENAEIYGGCFNISSVNNVAVRNVKIRDAYDPFPHHEKGDGFNAQHDCIVIQGSSYNIWIDHCTLQDSYHCAKAANGEKFQTYDGLLDMKNNTYNLTVSYCKFQDHDKTMLIGSSSTDGSNETRTITLHHNYFLNCGQRLPMVRNTKLHNFNNYYDTDSNKYWTQQYAVGVRENALIVSENNYFGTGVKYSYKDSDGTLYHSGDVDNSSGKITTTTVTSTKPFTPTYSYTPDAAADLPTLIPENAGAGVWSVVQ